MLSIIEAFCQIRKQKRLKQVFGSSVGWRQVAPLEKAGGGDEAGAAGVLGQLPGLPPEGVCLVHDLQDVAFPEGHASVGTRDGGVLLRVVVHRGPDVELRSRAQTSHEDGVRARRRWRRGAPTIIWW